MKIRGVASTPDEDADGEVLEPEGFDLSIFKTQGYINWHHMRDPSAIIGEPTKAEIKGRKLHLEATLYPEQKLAREAFELAQMLETNSTTRRLGFSIEGKAIERDPANPKRVTKAQITGCALTPLPKNPSTFAEIVKAMNVGDEQTLKFSIQKADLSEACWDGYEAYGLKNKNGKKVPNCVKKGDKWVFKSDCNYEGKSYKADSEVDDQDILEALDTVSGRPLMPESVGKKMKNLAGSEKLTKAQLIEKIKSGFSGISQKEREHIYFTAKLLQIMPTINPEEIQKAYDVLGITPDERAALSKAETDGPEDDDEDLDDSSIMMLAKQFGLSIKEVRDAISTGGGKMEKGTTKKGDLTITHEDEDEESSEELEMAKGEEVYDADEEEMDVTKAKGMKDGQIVKMHGNNYMRKGGKWYLHKGKTKKGEHKVGKNEYSDGDMMMLKAYADEEKKMKTMAKGISSKFKHKAQEMVPVKKTPATDKPGMGKKPGGAGADDFAKGLGGDAKLEAFVTLLKAHEQTISELRQHNQVLDEMVTTLTERVELQQELPAGRKSIIKAQGVERFNVNVTNDLLKSVQASGGKLVDLARPKVVMDALDSLSFNETLGDERQSLFQKAMTTYEASGYQVLPDKVIEEMAKEKFFVYNSMNVAGGE